MKKFLRYAFFLGALLPAWGDSALAATYVSITTGNWGSSSTWAALKSGTITTSSASTTVTGVGTLFTTELANGDRIYTAASALIGTVASRPTNTSLTLTANAASTNSGIPYYSTTATTPGAVDTATVNSPHTVTVASDLNSGPASVTINVGGTVTAPNHFDPGGVLNVAGTLNSSDELKVDGATTITGIVNITAGGGAGEFNGALTITGGTWNNAGNKDFKIRNGLTVNGGTFTYPFAF